MAEAIVVFTTTPNEAEARALAELLVNNKLAACVQILPPMTSIYFWEGAVQTEPEHLMLIKTLDEKFDDLAEFIRTHHSYSVPEIVAVPVSKISPSYDTWLKAVLSEP